METIEQLLESKNIRVTAMRLLIYKFLAEKKVAVTLSDIENAFEKADRTTLYRTIKTFEEKIIVHQIDDGTGITKYALCEQGCNCDIKITMAKPLTNPTITDLGIISINLPNTSKWAYMSLIYAQCFFALVLRQSKTNITFKVLYNRNLLHHM